MPIQTRRVTFLRPGNRYWIVATNRSAKAVTEWFSSWFEQGAFIVENEWGDERKRFVIFTVAPAAYVTAPTEAAVHEAPSEVTGPESVGIALPRGMSNGQRAIMLVGSIAILGMIGFTFVQQKRSERAFRRAWLNRKK